MAIFDNNKSSIKLGFMTTSSHETVYWYSILKEEKQLRKADLVVQKMMIRAKRQPFFQNVRNVQIFNNHTGDKVGQINDLTNLTIEWNVR